MSLTATTDRTFVDDVLMSTTPVLVEFTADWCPPCTMIAPVLERIAREQAGRLRVVSLDVDTNPETTRAHGVLGMPTMSLFVRGRVVAQVTGARPQAQLMKEFEPHLAARV